MNFFEYLFCRLYWWNTQIIKEKVTPRSYSVTGLSVFQTYSIFPLYALIYSLSFKTYHVGYLFGINICILINIIIIVVNIIYFQKSRYKILLKKFDKIPKEQKKKKDMLCIVYIVSIIIIINILFVTYFRSKNLGI